MSLLTPARPRPVAVALGAANITATVAGALVVAALWPHASEWTARLVVVLALAAAAVAVLAGTRGWSTAGFRARVGRPWLLILPAVIAVAPLIGGVQLPSAGMLAIFVIGTNGRCLTVRAQRPPRSAGRVLPGIEEDRTQE